METSLNPANPATYADSSVYGYSTYLAARITITAAGSSAAAHATRSACGQYDVFVDFVLSHSTHIAPAAGAVRYRSKDATSVVILQYLDDQHDMTVRALQTACTRAGIDTAVTYAIVYAAMLEQFGLFSTTKCRRDWLALNKISINADQAYQAFNPRHNPAAATR